MGHGNDTHTRHGNSLNSRARLRHGHMTQQFLEN